MEDKTTRLLQKPIEEDTHKAMNALTSSVGYQYIEEFLDSKISYFTAKLLKGTLTSMEEVAGYRAYIAAFTEVKDTINKFKS